MPHSIKKLRPFEVTVWPSEAGQDNPEPAVEVEPAALEVLLPVGATYAESAYTVSLLPAPQYSSGLPPQVMPQSVVSVMFAPELRLLPQ